MIVEIICMESGTVDNTGVCSIYDAIHLSPQGFAVIFGQHCKPLCVVRDYHFANFHGNSLSLRDTAPPHESILLSQYGLQSIPMREPPSWTSDFRLSHTISRIASLNFWTLKTWE